MTAETRENLHMAAIQASEYQLNDPIDHAGNANDQTSSKRGPYLVRGPSQHTIQTKKKSLKDVAAGSNGQIDAEALQKQLMWLDILTKQAKTGRQTSLGSFFVCKRSLSPSLMPLPSKHS